MQMALGKRERGKQNQWVATYDLPKSPGHHFYDKLNGLLEEACFDEHVEGICEQYYCDGRAGRAYRRGFNSACC